MQVNDQEMKRMREQSERGRTEALASGSSSATLLGEPHLTLTIEEIRDLAAMCGLVVKDALEKEKEDERETEIAITPWPATGIKDENGKPYALAHKHLAYFEEYPEEGVVPLGSPNDKLTDGSAKNQ